MQRSAINLQQKYNAKDLGEKPFVCYALVPDVSREQDPVIRRMAAAQALGIVNELYGGGGAHGAISGGPAPQMLETSEGPVDPSTGELVEGPSADELPDLPAEEPQAASDPIRLCGCPCGDQKEISEAVYQQTFKNAGDGRCGACYPSPYYDVKRHEELASLRFPKDPRMTPSKAATIARKLKAGA